MRGIYTPDGYDASYPELLRCIYRINDLLKSDGIMAPSDTALANVARAYELIGRPLDRIPVIHVGGTNGKGTTSFKVSECLHKSGLRTGLFVSPHLSSFRERVQINGHLVEEEEMVRNMPRVLQLCADEGIPLTLFEVTFIYACLQFSVSQCEAVVLEVGVGGELDATNVVGTTALSIICSVSLDHTRILGSTVEAIATQKAGIFKKGVDALVGPGCPLGVIQNMAEQRGAILKTLSQASREFSLTLQSRKWTGEESEEGEEGIVDTDALNADLSNAALHILRAQGGVFSKLDPSSTAVQDTLVKSRPPCRWEQHSVTVDDVGNRKVNIVLDVGHNPAAVGALMKRIRRDFADGSVHVLYAMSRDKDVRTCVRAVASSIPNRNIHFINSGNFRAISKADLADIFRQETGEEPFDLEAATPGYAEGTPQSGSRIKDTVGRLLMLAASESENSTVVICGTGYIMPDAREQLGIREPRDDYDLLRTT
jgi:dihydrofolate synthase/folylpolyglutamate synthase